eukprot:Colp12_sorted_trinity150504_noHs@25589
MAILQRMEAIPYRYLQKLGSDQELFKLCPIEVKRQIWQVNQTLYLDSVRPVIEDYLADPQHRFAKRDIYVHTPAQQKKRRQCESLRGLVHLIGTSLVLYNFLLEEIKQQYAKNGESALCTLRADIIMVLHDEGISQIYEKDPCHRLAWLVDACMRDNTIEPHQIKEFRSVFDTMTDSRTIRDAAVVLGDPYALFMLGTTLYNCLPALAENHRLPKDDDRVCFLAQLLEFGSSAKDAYGDQPFSFPRTSPELVHRLLPLLCACLIDDTMLAASPSDVEANSLVDLARLQSIASSSPAGTQLLVLH